MKRLHLPSILIGALLGLCVVLSMGGTDDGDARYQIAAAGAGEGFMTVYILDTTTGHVWSRSADGIRMTDYGTLSQPVHRGLHVPNVP